MLARLREQRNTRGTLDVLRHGIEMIGLRHNLPLAQFKPARAMSLEINTKSRCRKFDCVKGERV